MINAARPSSGAFFKVVDDAFDRLLQRQLFKFLMSDLGFRFSRVNNIGQDDFPSLSAAIVLKHIKVSPVLSRIVGVAAEAINCQKGSVLSLRRAQVNVTTFGDIQHIHRDLDSDYTAIYFANPEWKVDWLGELYFYDSEDTEVVAAVTPRPGRLVVFDSSARHRGGVPSRISKVPRVTLALKFCRVET